jgi:CheY-like chemotaxis protein
MRANARQGLAWKYNGHGSQTATWENYVFAVWLDMKDAEGKRWHLTTWEVGRENLTKGLIFKSDTLVSVYQHAERLAGELAQFKDIVQEEEPDRHSLDLKMDIFEDGSAQFRTGAEVVRSIRQASIALRHAALWLCTAPVSKDKLPIVTALARGLNATADDTDSRLVDIEWSLKR